MSIMRDLQHSAATPGSSTQQAGRQAAAGQHARPAATRAADDGGFDTSDSEDEDAGEASTTIGAAQLAAAADRAANRMAGLRAQAGSSGGGLKAASMQQQRQLGTPPRVPASSPAVRSPAALGWQQQRQASVLQAAADRMAQDCLATPMSQLSLSRAARPGRSAGAVTPTALLDGGLSQEAAASGLPASPAEKLIGLMMSPNAGGHRRHHHHHSQQQQQGQQATPSRLSAALGAIDPQAQAPLSPNLQVIDLMMHPDAAAEEGQAGAGCSSVGGGSDAAQGAAADAGASSDDGSGCSSEPESDDEMDLAELQALCGEGVGPDTPLSVILGMLTGTPQVTGLTPSLEGVEQQQQQGGNDDIGPRVLFADD